MTPKKVLAPMLIDCLQAVKNDGTERFSFIVLSVDQLYRKITELEDKLEKINATRKIYSPV